MEEEKQGELKVLNIQMAGDAAEPLVVVTHLPTLLLYIKINLNAFSASDLQSSSMVDFKLLQFLSQEEGGESTRWHKTIGLLYRLVQHPPRRPILNPTTRLAIDFITFAIVVIV
jgi:hypothetical protein